MSVDLLDRDGWALRPPNPDYARLGAAFAKATKAAKEWNDLATWFLNGSLRGVSPLVMSYVMNRITDEECEREVQARLRAGWGIK